MKNNIVVSILCITFNHEKFIEDALRSFLNQKTDFQFEIIVHDDASTDSTVEIIKKYQLFYPNIIKPILEQENQYSKGINITRSILKYAQGIYIATCEGDDFWTDEYKLQKQVDYMKKHPNCSMYGHANYIVNKNGEKLEIRCGCKCTGKVNLITDGGYMHVATRLAKKEVYTEIPEYLYKKYYGGVSYVYFAHTLGYLYFDTTPMSAWRINPDSVTHTIYLGFYKKKEIVRDYLLFYKKFDNFTKGKYSKNIIHSEAEQLTELVREYSRYLSKSELTDIIKHRAFKDMSLKFKIYIMISRLIGINKYVYKK